MTLIDSWDSDQPGATWDSGLQWDVNSGPALGDVAPYLALITSEHNKQPDFMATVAFLLQPLADNIAVLHTLPALFDIETAVGDQLDILGEWIGQSRELAVPLTGVYFSFDTDGVGFDQGTWKGPFDPNTYLVSLPDDTYRTLLKIKLLNNSWDGTIPGAYAIWNSVYQGALWDEAGATWDSGLSWDTATGLLIQDFGNMHMLFAITGAVPDAVMLALFTGGYLTNRPAGIQVDAYVTPSVADVPYFGFDVQNASISGFDTGAWGTLTLPS